MDDVTLLIQGFLCNTTMTALDIYMKIFKHIVLSCYNTDNMEYLDLTKKIDKIIISEPADSKEYRVNDYQCKQATSCLNGLRNIDTEFVIKVRSDEYYTKFDKLIKMIHDEPDKLITGDIHFRFDPDGVNRLKYPDRYYEKFHPSDHYYAAKTKTMIYAYKDILKACKGLRSDIACTPAEYNGEKLLCLGFLAAKGILRDDSNSVEIMKQNVNICPVESMGDVIIRMNKHGVEVRNSRVYTENYLDVREMKEL